MREVACGAAMRLILFALAGLVLAAWLVYWLAMVLAPLVAVAVPNTVVLRYSGVHPPPAVHGALTALAARLNRTEICDPLPCRVVLEVDRVDELAEPVPLDEEALGLMPGSGPAPGAAGGSDGPAGRICPAGSFLVRGRFRDRWWSPSRSPLDGREVAICVGKSVPPG